MRRPGSTVSTSIRGRCRCATFASSIVPRLFRLPWFRRFDGYAAHGTILLRSASLLDDGDLVTHELCHVWQMQHHPLRMPLSYVVRGYADNPYEAEARTPPP